MKKNKLRRSAIALSAALALILTGCSTGNTAAAPVQKHVTTIPNFKVGLVTDTGGLNDHSFNHLAYLGLLKAESVYHIKGSVVESRQSSDYIPNLSTYAQQGYNLVIAVGYLMDQAVQQVAAKYPNTKFMIIDDAITNHKNVASSLFSTEQGGYLVGVMAELMNKQKHIPQINGKNILGLIGGVDIPPVESYMAGFVAGVHKIDPKATVLINWANSFSDPTTGKIIANQQISKGADIIFPVAGATGNGAIDAAQEHNVFAIGVDANQNYLAPKNVMTSALKAVDVATTTIIGQALHNQFKSGINMFNLKNNGVGYAAPIPAVPTSVLKQVRSYVPLIESGAIKPPALLSSH